MSHARASTAALIGFFFLLALGLFLGALVFLSTGLRSSGDDSFLVLCFDTSLNGLEVGAPVKFRGVRIGSVEKISISYDAEQSTVKTPITIKIDSDFLDYGEAHEAHHPHDGVLVAKASTAQTIHFYQEQIAKGLSAKLGTESFLTGKLFIELDYYDSQRVRQLIPIPQASGEKKWPQIPTVYSDIDRFLRQVSHINLPLLLEHVEDCIQHLDEKIQGTDMEAITQMAQSFREFSRSATELVRSEALQQGLVALRDTFVQSSQAFKMLNALFPELKDDFRRIAAQIFGLIEEIRSGVASLCDEDMPLQREFVRTLKHVSDMICQLQSLIDYFERNPNAILAGKQP
ncbi:MAG: MlaD family protein [Puniceicoccales bacterium]|jgi:paraquat-inducible protein B|nr:MlaD family protein [Puniceicoccales bacterium]